MSTLSGSQWMAQRLTWQDHEFLDATRSNTLWERAKAESLKQTGGLGLDLITAYLRHLGKEALGIG